MIIIADILLGTALVSIGLCLVALGIIALKLARDL